MEYEEYYTVQAKNGEFYISPEDKPVEDMCRWSIRGDGYVLGSINGKTKLLHRLIMERTLGRMIKSGYVVDHINGVRSDNRRENLREVTASENGKNKPGCYVYIPCSESETMFRTQKLTLKTRKTSSQKLIDIKKEIRAENVGNKTKIGIENIKPNPASRTCTAQVIKLKSEKPFSYYQLASDTGKDVRRFISLDEISEEIENVILLLNAFFKTYTDTAFILKTSEGVLLDSETVENFLGYVYDHTQNGTSTLCTSLLLLNMALDELASTISG
ncbi:HNH endonuclease signature motif containing protein [Aerosakkonemataceae cyanobacterium BLCC-F154]|uniref:HNH endonuclease signature motif containing protein n=1 Tax=Floridaenema fluviatile BLCC-F154 TaxID=3153640 RepID=A0ABV4YJF5_9CYAN